MSLTELGDTLKNVLGGVDVPVRPKEELMMECDHLEAGDTSPLTLQEEVQDRAPGSQAN